ncbi:MAG: trehalose-6-phosphate synthase [Anaerolineae bacterium]|nr:trehalose-6-phosphate synthase [Anaerolineae bacterium]
MNAEMSDHIVVVSNRGPFTFTQKNGQFMAKRGSGGLVTAISSVVRQNDVLWISYALSEEDRQWVETVGNCVQTVDNMKIRLVVPAPEQYDAYYNTISNPLLWFIQHQLYDSSRYPVIDESVWKAWANGYVAMNRHMATAVAESIAGLNGHVLVMVQDYHLYMVPQFLRELVSSRNVTIQSFVHIPWPGPDVWRILPAAMRQALLTAMLQSDRVGFQTERDTRRFLQTCVDNLKGVQVVRPWRALQYKGHLTHAAPYPISVDVDDLHTQLAGSEVQKHISQLRTVYGNRRMILRVDRMEPSKNIIRGLIAYRNFLMTYPQYQGQVYMLALLVPSRTEITEYKDYLRDVMALAGEINATLGTGDWEPVHITLGNNYPRAIAALSQYDVLLVNALADGMNLVAKEGAILNQRNGVLILSEEAGAAEELGEYSLLVSPFDVYGTREALHKALSMPPAERRSRAEKMADQVRRNDIHHWFDQQLTDAKSDFLAYSLTMPTDVTQLSTTIASEGTPTDSAVVSPPHETSVETRRK